MMEQFPPPAAPGDWYEYMHATETYWRGVYTGWLLPRSCWWCQVLLHPEESDPEGWDVCQLCCEWYQRAYCYWCWRPAEVWYPGWPLFHMPLCERCSLRYVDGSGPPWYPNHSQRCQLYIRWLFEEQRHDTGYRLLPGEVCDLVAVFLAVPWRP